VVHFAQRRGNPPRMVSEDANAVRTARKGKKKGMTHGGIRNGS
jgi:hypothetical protein